MTRSKLIITLILGAFFTFGISLSLPAMAKLYKWVDENGTTHYGETIPPEYANKDRAELNKSGRIVKERDVLTREELHEARKKKEQEEAEKRAEEEATLQSNRRDKALIGTYSNSNEIDLARKRNLQQIELQINGINANIKIASDNLLGLQNEADAYTKAGKEIPPSLKEDLLKTQNRLDKLNKDLEKPQAKKEEMEARYDADKARYKELTGK